jgi:cytochrome c oxidase subunit IV
MADTATTETTSSQASGQAHGAHPTPKLYVQIALVLFVLTIMEFGTFIIDFGRLHIPVLLGLMFVKFLLVAGYFMHLKYDTRLFTRLMATGLIGAMILYAITIFATIEKPPTGWL